MKYIYIKIFIDIILLWRTKSYLANLDVKVNEMLREPKLQNVFFFNTEIQYSKPTISLDKANWPN